MQGIADAPIMLTVKQVIGGAVAFAITMAVAQWAVLSFTVGGLADNVSDIRQDMREVRAAVVEGTINDVRTEFDLRGTITQIAADVADGRSQFEDLRDEVKDASVVIYEVRDHLGAIDTRLASIEEAVTRP